MFNLGYRFLISFFGLTFTILLIANLLLYGQIGSFGDIIGAENSYFGFSSFIESINLFETAMGNSISREFFSASRFVDVLLKLANSLALGIPESIEDFMSADWNFANVTQLPVFPEISISTIEDFFAMFDLVFTWIGQVLQKYWAVIGIAVTLLRILFAPIYTLVYLLYILLFSIYYVIVIFIWLVYLFQGRLSKPLPSHSYSQWSSIVDYWNDQWSSLPQGLIALSL